MKMAGFDQLVDRMMMEFPEMAPVVIGKNIKCLTAPEGMDNCEDAYFIEAIPGSTASLWCLNQQEISDIIKTHMMWVNVYYGGKTQPPIAAFSRWQGDHEPLFECTGPADWREQVDEAHLRFLREGIGEMIVLDKEEAKGSK